MHRTTAALCIAASVGLGAALEAQSSATAPTPGQRPTSNQRATSDHEREVNVTGCLARASDGKFTLTNARVEPIGSASSTTTGATASSATTTAGTSGSAATTTATEPAGSGSRSASAMTWSLSGGKDLDKHVGHKIQVTGRAKDDAMTHSTSSTTTTATTTDTKGPELEVQSIKMISDSCS